MKKLIAALFVLVALTAACTKPTGGKATTASHKPRVALIMKSLANEFFSTMAEGAKQHQAAHADSYDLIVNGIKNETDLAEQVNLVEQMIAQQVDAIVIAPADSKAAGHRAEARPATRASSSSTSTTSSMPRC